VPVGAAWKPNGLSALSFLNSSTCLSSLCQRNGESQAPAIGRSN